MDRVTVGPAAAGERGAPTEPFGARASLEDTHAASRGPRFEDAVRSILHICKTLTRAGVAFAAVLSEDGVSHQFIFPHFGQLHRLIDPSLPVPVRALQAEACRTRQATYRNDFATGEMARLSPEGHAVLENVLFAPMVVDGKAEGLLGLANKPGGFTDEDAALASEFAHLSAISFADSRALELLKRSESYFQSVAEAASEGMACADARERIARVFRDVGQRKRAGKRLLHAQRLEMAARVAAQVSHDLANLMVPLVGMPELIKEQLPEGHPAARMCDVMLEAARQMAEINSNLMALGKRARHPHQPLDLNALVTQVLEGMAARPASLVVHLDLAPDPRPVLGSPAQLLRVIANLVSNAREAMRDRGRLSIETKHATPHETRGDQPDAADRRYVRLTVADTGRGVPAELRERIFEPFFTTKDTSSVPGSGLGLSIVQAIVEDHQGFVRLESEVGDGSSFHVYLPAVDRP